MVAVISDSEFEDRPCDGGKSRKRRTAVEFKQRRVVPLADIDCVDLKRFVGDADVCTAEIVRCRNSCPLPSFFGLNWAYVAEALADAPVLIEEHSCTAAPKTCDRLRRYADALRFAAGRLASLQRELDRASAVGRGMKRKLGAQPVR